MWRQDDLFNVLGAGGNALLGHPAGDVGRRSWPARIDPDAPRPVMLVACPLMHGTGQFSALIALHRRRHGRHPCRSRKFDAAELCDEVERLQATAIVIVGQAFAGPMLDALDANPGRYDLSQRALDHARRA